MLVFVSYARNDNLKPRGAKGGEDERYGFVTTLVRSTEQYLTDAGVGSQVKLFIDTRDIPDDASFNDLIPSELAKADVLLVILSNNWVQRSWCLKELDYFVQRFPSEAEAQSRIVIVRKHDVKGPLPSGLPVQTGVCFYREDKEEPTGYFEYFKISDGPRRGFDDAVERLAAIIERRVGESLPPAVPPEPDKPSRRVFVAKPAPDMEKSYRNFVQELQRRDFTVVPEATGSFSIDMTEPQIAAELDTALRDAELSVHMLGNSRGFTPADGTQSIVQLQAARAAARRAARLKNDAGVPFRRLFWAPKVLIVDDDVVGTVRDPEEVRSQVTDRIDDDSVFGENFTKFTQFVLDRLAATAPAPVVSQLHEGANVYLQYQPPSEQYAAKVGLALRARNLDVSWQRRAGPDALAKHKKFLRECDAVVVCWAEGPDGDALSPFDETNLDPRQLGRDKRFDCRSLVVGPPEDVPGKTMALSLAQNKEDGVDLVLNLTKYESPPPSEFDPLVKATHHDGEPEASP